MIFAFGAIIFSLLDRAIVSVASPIWKSESSIIRSLRNVTAYFSSHKKLAQENVALKEKLSSFESQALSLSGWQARENLLLELIGRKPEPNTIISSVLTYPPQTPYDVVIIDVGSDDAVKVGSEVFLPEGPLIGKVSEIFPKKAKVKLLSADGEETGAILERHNVAVTLIGVGGGNLKMELPHDVAVESGDRILSADVTGRLLAIVGGIEAKPTNSFKEVLATGPLNIFNLRFVFVKP